MLENVWMKNLTLIQTFCSFNHTFTGWHKTRHATCSNKWVICVFLVLEYIQKGSQIQHVVNKFKSINLKWRPHCCLKEATTSGCMYPYQMWCKIIANNSDQLSLECWTDWWQKNILQFDFVNVTQHVTLFCEYMN